jgi:hypothetical protein
MRWPKIVTLVFFLVSLSSCLPAITVRPVDPFVRDYVLATSRATAFDASLRAAQESNLDVAVLDRESGLLRFEAAAVSATQLDRYCLYPVVDRSGEAQATFAEWNAGLPLRGAVTLSLLFSEVTEGTSINVRSNWTVSNSQVVYPCQSTGVLEDEIIELIEEMTR